MGSTSHSFTGTSRYQILRKLGEGGMGAVYEARDVERDVSVALKVLTHSEPRALLRFKTEYRSLQDLEHPNLVRLGELGESDGFWYFSMEMVDGVDLIEHVRGEVEAEPGFDERRLRASFQQLALGLSALHSANKIHRDIKPSNVLVTRAGRVVLLDFGLVADTAGESETTDGYVIGTAAYMSPEQATGRHAGPESDWYSFGSVLYRALTGKLPFSGSAIEMLMDKQTRDPPSPRSLVPGVPEDLDRLCLDLLRFDPEQRPPGADVLRRLGLSEVQTRVPAGWATPVTDAQVFVGRDDELARLRAALYEPLNGTAALVHVHGQSGMGKTSLVNRFLDELQIGDEPPVVLRGRCYEQESVPFKAIDGVIDALSRVLTRLPDDVRELVLPPDAALLPTLFPVLGRVETIARMKRPRPMPADLHEARQATFRALRALLRRLAEHRLLVVSIDDFQWTDRDSVTLLRTLIGDADARPAIALIVTSREQALPDVLSGDDLDWQLIEVGPLGGNDGVELARRLMVRADPRVRVDCSALAGEAQGHPLFIAELVRHVTTADRDQTVKLELDDAIRQRVRALPAPARSIVELLCVAVAPLTVDTVELATGLGGDELARTLALLRVAALVRTSRERPTHRVRPYHDRVREAVSRHVPEQTATGYHLRLASALEADANAAPEAVAHHALAAGLVDKAAEFYERAADRAVAGLAFDRAVSLYRKVIELTEPSATEAVGLRVRIAEALVHAGRGVEAAAEYAAAAEGANAADRIRLRNLGAIHLLRSGHVDEGLTALGDVLRDVGLSIPRSRASALPVLLLERLRLGLRGYRCTLRDASEVAPRDLMRVDALAGVAESLAWVDGIRAAGIGTRWLRAALSGGERDQVIRALCFEAVFCSLPGPRRAAKAQRILDRAAEIADAMPRPETEHYIETSRAFVAQHECRFGDTYRIGRNLIVDYEALPEQLPWELATVRLVWLFGLLMTGRFGQFADTAELMLRDADERRDRWFSSLLRVLMAPWAALTRYDDPAQARAALDRGIEPWRDREFGLIHFNWLNSASWAEIYLGNGKAAVDLMREQRRALARSGSLRVLLLRVSINGTDAAGHLAWYDESGDPSALARARKLARALERDRVGYGTGSANNVYASIAMRQGDPETAVRHMIVAERDFRASGMDGFAMGIQWKRGQLIGGDEGAAAVAEAEAFFEREGVANPTAFCRCLSFPTD